ncbi:MAG: hypothetical protein K2N23_08515 [Clostridia bacterium]|nr:hypothetical protein [Clostridia bacterium]
MKKNKKIIIVVLLIAILIGTVYIIDKGKNARTSSTVANSAKSDTEIRLKNILSNIDGVGNTDVMVTENEGEIIGVVIVCEGADNLMTRSNILNAVSTVLNIDKKIIAIYSLTV